MNDLKMQFLTMRKLKFPFSELRTLTRKILYQNSILQLITNQVRGSHVRPQGGRGGTCPPPEKPKKLKKYA